MVFLISSEELDEGASQVRFCEGGHELHSTNESATQRYLITLAEFE